MAFSNLLFLYILLPLLILVYFLMPDIRKRKLVLLAASLLFYAMGNPVHLILMAVLSYLNWRFAFRVVSDDRMTVLVPVVLNLVVLAAFKYVAPFLNTFGYGIDGFSIAFPVGLSIFVFSLISYLVDIYTGQTEPEENFFNLLLYLMMFPKLIQGPIVRYEQICSQLNFRRHSPRAVFEGLQRFLFGLAKKILLADHCGMILAEVNACGGDNTLVGVWYAAILFAFRVYFDFSGCCDMAIGLGKIFGFRYSENFKRPYLSQNVQEFWSRWNVTLGHFFRDYVYLPLGGAELGKNRQLINMLIAWVMVGLWHGAGVNFLAWGVYFWVIYVAEEHFASTIEKLPIGICRLVTLWFVLFGWIIFSNNTLTDLKAAMLAVLGYGGMAVDGLMSMIVQSLPLLFLCFLGCTETPVYIQNIVTGICGMGRRRQDPGTVTVMRVVYLIVTTAVMIGLLWLCTISLVRNPALMPVYAGY